MKFSLRFAVFLSLLAVLLPFFISPLIAQESKAAPSGQTALNCILTGKVTASGSEQAIGFASVTLLQRADSSLIAGVMTDEKGVFRIEHIPAGQYKIKIKFIGFEANVRELTLKEGLLDLGFCQLKQSGKQLSEIVISEEKADIQMGMDKKVFNVENDLNSKGGSAVDVLKNIPSMNVDVEGNIILRGSGNVTVLIDGRASGMGGTNSSTFLEQIPSSSIERIELITNPSSKYDPDGITGIVNIILKKNKLQGWNVNAALSYGTFNKLNSSLNLGYRNQKINVYAGLTYRYNEKWYSGYTNRRNMLTDTSFSINQTSIGIRSTQTQLLKAGIEYSLDSKNTLSFSCLLNHDRDRDFDQVAYAYIDRNEMLRESGQRNMNGLGTLQGRDASLNYSRTFDRAEKLLSVEVSSSFNKNRTVDSIGQQNYFPDHSPVQLYPSVQRTDNRGSLLLYKTKVDLIQPVGANARIEGGLKMSYRKLDASFLSDTMNQPAGNWIRDTSINNHFYFEEQVYGAYASWNQKVQKIDYELGGRMEDTRTIVRLGNTNASFLQHYTDLFPYAHISWKISGTSEMRLGYSRRIAKPVMRFLNPFADYTDPRNLHFGNPYLKPEYAHMFELNYVKYFKKISVNGSLYYRIVENAIQMYKTLSDTLRGTVTSTFMNLRREDILGVDFIANMDLVKWLNLSGSMNSYQVIINGNDPNTPWHLNSFNLIAKMTGRATLKKGFMLLVSGSYSKPQNVIQGRIHAQYYLDAAIRKDFMHGKFSASLGLTDVFNTFDNRTEVMTPNISQQYLKKRESRVATLSLSYNFGQMTEGSRKHKTAEEAPLPALPEAE
jgi:iron complex outermembrane receptor protein